MQGKKATWIVALVLIGADWMLNSRVGDSFNDEAHKILSTRAVNPSLPNASTLDSFLKDVLGFEFLQGIAQPLHGGQDGTVVGQIRVGSINEDKGTRPRNHFHDPTRLWGTAGLFQGAPIAGGQSSVVWSQNQSQSEGRRSWKDARDAYFKALTSNTSELRKSWYAELFQTIGHLIHLVQDAAVPSHTRNDSHLVVPDNVPAFGGLKIDADPFHYWADSPVGLNRINSVSQAFRFDQSVLNQSNPNQLAPGPIARIIDKTDGDLGILSPNSNIGLAEYSNANFISKGTARSTTYQYPTYLQLEFPLDTSPSGAKRRYARFRMGFGETDYRVGVSSRMARFVNATVPPDSIDFGLDDNVHADYGRKLFPRAIGYSAGLIDYFFRGQIFADSADSTSCAWPQTPGLPPTGTMWVWNASPEGEEMGFGQLDFIFHYEVGGVKHFIPLVSTSAFVTRDQRTQFTFSTAPLNAVPTNATNWFTIIAYRGPLGKETNAVVGGRGHLAPDC